MKSSKILKAISEAVSDEDIYTLASRSLKSKEALDAWNEATHVFNNQLFWHFTGEGAGRPIVTLEDLNELAMAWRKTTPYAVDAEWASVVLVHRVTFDECLLEPEYPVAYAVNTILEHSNVYFRWDEECAIISLKDDSLLKLYVTNGHITISHDGVVIKDEDQSSDELFRTTINIIEVYSGRRHIDKI